MQVFDPQPRIVVARSVIELLQEAMVSTVRLVPDPQPPVGGILLGKRLSPHEIAILAASTPGPTPENYQLGFALDSTHANAWLEDWLTRDSTVDFLGLWHTYPSYLAQPTTSDVEVAQKLVVDPAYNAVEVVNLIVQVDQRPPQIQCFYLHRDAAEQSADVSFVPYDVLDDNDPLLSGQGVEEAPRPTVNEGAVPVSATMPPPTTSRRPTVRGAALVSLLVVLLVAGVALARMQIPRTGGSTAGTLRTSVSEIGGSTGIPVPATPTTRATPSTGPVATRPAAATPTIMPSPLPTRSTPTAQPALLTAITSPTLPPASPSSVPSIQARSGLPYVLQLEPMDAAYQRGFLNRLQLANCAGCYNIDLISPVPFREMRIKVAGSVAAPVSNFVEPSPLELPPSPLPYTLQAFDLQGNPLSEPVTFTIADGALYILRITPL